MDTTDSIQREWWTERWLEVLETYRFKKRLERARNYAREGNVLSIDFQDRKVIAKVQGSESDPYEVSIWMNVFSDEDWNYVIETMAERAIFAAKLLAGEMPDNIEEVFAANGLSLFPFTLKEVRGHCSCPDKANPCKHIGAVYYLLGDRFSEDPFVLFQLRGRTKEQIVAKLRELRSGNVEQSALDSGEIKSAIATYKPPELDKFWEYDTPLESSLVVIAPPPSSETILDVLGPIPFSAKMGKASESKEVMAYLQAVYQQASQQAIMSALNREA